MRWDLLNYRTDLNSFCGRFECSIGSNIVLIGVIDIFSNKIDNRKGNSIGRRDIACAVKKE